MDLTYELSDAVVVQYVEATAGRYAAAAVLRFRVAVDEVALIAGGRSDLLRQAAEDLMAGRAGPETPRQAGPLAAAICLTAAEGRDPALVPAFARGCPLR